MGKQVYYKKVEPQTEKCTYCRNLEEQLVKTDKRINQFFEGNFGLIARFDDRYSQYITTKLLEKEGLTNAVSQCSFPYCKGCKRGDRYE